MNTYTLSLISNKKRTVALHYECFRAAKRAGHTSSMAQHRSIILSHADSIIGICKINIGKIKISHGLGILGLTLNDIAINDRPWRS